MKSMHHGMLYYAVDSRDIGTFGGRAKSSTIKIYDTRNCGRPLVTVSGADVRTMRDKLAAMSERTAREDYFRAVIQARSTI
jgi:hypothetical protein